MPLVPAAPLLEVVLPRLVNALVEASDVVLIVDDFHRLSGRSAQESSLRAHGQLVELRADALRFTPSAAGEFLNGRLGLGLDSTTSRCWSRAGKTRRRR
jgi:hypothetical protein